MLRSLARSSAQPEILLAAELEQAVARIQVKRRRVSQARSLLVGISGIDGAGKGYVTDKLAAALTSRDLRTAAINVDGWLNLPHKRFSQERPAEHFYRHAIRFDDLFAQLVLPLKDKRTHCVVADFVEETATSYRAHRYDFEEIDVIILEGIYLFKAIYRRHFDLAFWVECSFETALERAIARAQEGLAPIETIRAYETIYFSAQRIHFAEDAPRASADFIIHNDPQLFVGCAARTRSPGAHGAPTSMYQYNEENRPCKTTS